MISLHTARQSSLRSFSVRHHAGGQLVRRSPHRNARSAICRAPTTICVCRRCRAETDAQVRCGRTALHLSGHAGSLALRRLLGLGLISSSIPRWLQSTTPVDPRVLDAMLPLYTESYGNPHSRTHVYGWEAEQLVEVRRALLGCGMVRDWSVCRVSLPPCGCVDPLVDLYS